MSEHEATLRKRIPSGDATLREGTAVYESTLREGGVAGAAGAGQLNLVLTDFGITSLSDGTMHLTNANRTASYSAPEAPRRRPRLHQLDERKKP